MFLLKTLRRNNNLNKLDNCWCEYRGTLLENNLLLADLLVFEGLGHLSDSQARKSAPLFFFFLKTIWVSDCIDAYIGHKLWTPVDTKGFIQFYTVEILFLLSSVQGVCVWNGLPAMESHAWLAVLCNFIIIWAMHLISHLIWQINSSPQFNRWQGQIQQGDLHWVSSVG